MRRQIGSTFMIDAGDGDQDFVGMPMTACRVSEPWFGNMLARGEAYLLRVTSGKYVGDYIAVTSRLTASLREQLANSPWASVVVHRLLSPSEGFHPTLESAPAIGMAAIKAE